MTVGPIKYTENKEDDFRKKAFLLETLTHWTLYSLELIKIITIENATKNLAKNIIMKENLEKCKFNLRLLFYCISNRAILTSNFLPSCKYSTIFLIAKLIYQNVKI